MRRIGNAQLIIVLVSVSMAVGCAGTKPMPLTEDAPRLVTADVRPRGDDLPGIRVVDRVSGAVIRVYYEGEVEGLARRYVPTLVSMYAELAHLVAADPGEIVWSAVAFVQDPDWVPPRHPGEVRWSVLVDSLEELGPRGRQDLFRTLPHEQVHAIQHALSPGLPRWFSEGMAEWAGLHVTNRFAPELAEGRRARLHAAFESLGENLNLSGWGGVTVRREAILRQVTPDQRARMESDPSYMPPGPFRFGPEDMISDEANTPARYGGSLALFEMIERTVGREDMHAWLGAVWQAGKRLNTEELITLAEDHTGVDLRPWFSR
jgi:hypothetical protein